MRVKIYQWFAISIILVSIVSCANKRLTQAQNMLSDRQYEDAVYFSQSLLAEEPDNLEYQKIWESARRQAAKEYIQKAQEYRLKDLISSQHYYAKAKQLANDEPGLQQLESMLLISQTDWEIAVARIRNLLEQKKWLEAMEYLKTLRNYKNSTPEWQFMYNMAQEMGFNSYFQKGKSDFKSQIYNRAIEQFSICLKIRPDDSIATQWQKIAIAHDRCQKSLEQAKVLFQQRKFDQSYLISYGAFQALENLNRPYFDLSLYHETEKLWKLAQENWCQELYEQARIEENLRNLVGYLNSLKLYRTCLSKITPYLDCEQRIITNQREISLLLMERAEELLAFPQLRYAGLAYKLLREASNYDSNITNLAEKSRYVKELAHAKLKNIILVNVQLFPTSYIHIIQNDDLKSEEISGRHNVDTAKFSQQLQRDLVSMIKEKDYAFIEVAYQGDQNLQKDYLQKLHQLKQEVKEKDIDVALPIYELKIEVLNHATAKTGINSKFDRISEYFIRDQRIESPNFQKYQVYNEIFQQKKETSSALENSLSLQTQDRLQAMLSAQRQVEIARQSVSLAQENQHRWQDRQSYISSERERVRNKIRKNQEEIAQYNRQIAEYRRRYQEAQTPQDKEYYRRKIDSAIKERDLLEDYNNNEAQRLLRQFQSELEEANHQLELAIRERRIAQQDYDESEKEFRVRENEYNNVNDIHKEVLSFMNKSDSELRKLGAQPEKDQFIPIQTAYQYEYYPYQVFGQVWIKGYILDTRTNTRLLALESKVENFVEDFSKKYIKNNDARQFQNREEMLPSASQFLEKLEFKSIEEIKLSLDQFFQKYHEQYWLRSQDNLSQGHILEAGEDLSLFELCLQYKNLPLPAQAKEQLQEIIEERKNP